MQSTVFLWYSLKFFNKRYSVSASKDDVHSSNNKIGASLNKALAIAIR